MRRYKVELTVSVIVRADDEEHAIGESLSNIHDGTIRVMHVEEYDDHPTVVNYPDVRQAR